MDPRRAPELMAPPEFLNRGIGQDLSISSRSQVHIMHHGQIGVKICEIESLRGGSIKQK
jgi:hypothetical protein